ncbi:MAG: tRNA uridine-5-carboxymethylaminomethyl(34) synthesis enzyme MnmG [Lachnospiraceae bacterium]|nr:tRNA uridine-5-carboxymethylaminomethyl(34) synthesis enzyme MnmG [Lachnospiraceae bacterium]
MSAERITDVIIIGAGHAGCEAALATARLGCRTAVFCMHTDHVAFMPCNPHIGGSSKGHLVREIDALGGEMGKAIDKTFLQSRMLNRSKGPAVHSLRAQADKQAYSAYMRRALESEENIELRQAEVVSILTEADAEGARRVSGVRLATGVVYRASVCIICTGTYLNARCLTGEAVSFTGPSGLQASNSLSDALASLGIRLQRFKTGTPARMNGKSIDYSKMQIQEGDVPVIPFSFDTNPDDVQIGQMPCYLTYTNEKTHETIRKSLSRSPIYAGIIEGTGPRYCPSIEDKVVKFPEKDRHQVFVEPEGRFTNEVYIDGMSSSMPEDVQWEMYRTVPGLEQCRIVKCAYAIEYDCLSPGQLTAQLEIKGIAGLYCAGQMNGSSGYEEAAAQGLYAGVNAANALLHRQPLQIDRSEGYIGVLVDDLVHKEHTEPYRMMTSRAEYRLLLRQDNADLRLREKGYRAGLISEEQYQRLTLKRGLIDEEVKRLRETTVGVTDAVQQFLLEQGSTPLKSGCSLSSLLCRPEMTLNALSAIDPGKPAYVSRETFSETPLSEAMADAIREQVQIRIKYEGYIERQEKQVTRFRKLEQKQIPRHLDYGGIRGLRLEAAQKLARFRPESIGAASRIGGVNPADISVLMVYLESHRDGET